MTANRTLIGILGISLLCCFVAACTTIDSGAVAASNRDKVSQIHPGETKADVERIMGGEPNSTYFSANGGTVWTYEFSEAGYTASSIAATGASFFVPYAGMLSGESQSKSYRVQILFTSDGIVRDVATSHVNGHTGMLGM